MKMTGHLDVAAVLSLGNLKRSSFMMSR